MDGSRAVLEVTFSSLPFYPFLFSFVLETSSCYVARSYGNLGSSQVASPAVESWKCYHVLIFPWPTSVCVLCFCSCLYTYMFKSTWLCLGVRGRCLVCPLSTLLMREPLSLNWEHADFIGLSGLSTLGSFLSLPPQQYG